MARVVASVALVCILMLSASAETTLVKRNARYRLNPSDVLEVDFRLSPEFNERADTAGRFYYDTEHRRC